MLSDVPQRGEIYPELWLKASIKWHVKIVTSSTSPVPARARELEADHLIHSPSRRLLLSRNDARGNPSS